MDLTGCELQHRCPLHSRPSIACETYRSKKFSRKKVQRIKIGSWAKIKVTPLQNKETGCCRNFRTHEFLCVSSCTSLLEQVSRSLANNLLADKQTAAAAAALVSDPSLKIIIKFERECWKINGNSLVTREGM